MQFPQWNCWPDHRFIILIIMVHVICCLNMFWNHVPNPIYFVTQCIEPKCLSIGIRLNKLTTLTEVVHPFYIQVQVQKADLIQKLDWVGDGIYTFQHQLFSIGTHKDLLSSIIQYKTSQNHWIPHAMPFCGLFPFCKHSCSTKHTGLNNNTKIRDHKSVIQLDFYLFIQKLWDPVKAWTWFDAREQTYDISLRNKNKNKAVCHLCVDQASLHIC